MKKNKKIIHVDMDYFFAQVEILNRPELRNKPVAIGGDGRKGVLSTCNYVARKYGVRSGMPGFIAKNLCPDLIFLRSNFTKYRKASDIVFEIFSEFTNKIEGVSLDEAYLDVTESEKCHNSATLMAIEIKKKILKQTGLTASAGVSFNKLIAKLSSDYNKPNGLVVVPPGVELDFLKSIPIGDMNGVGKVTQEKMKLLGIFTFSDLQKFCKLDLINLFGNYGTILFNFARGIDNREVETLRVRKSLSVENTFMEDIKSIEEIRSNLHDSYERMKSRLENYSDRSIKSQFVKIKYSDFSKTTVESQFSGVLSFDMFLSLCLKRIGDNFNSIRLLGTGVRFHNPNHLKDQLALPIAF